MPTASASAASARASSSRLSDRLSGPGAMSWYIGAASGLLWQIILVVFVVLTPGPIPAKILGLAFLAVLYAAFLIAGPILWPESVLTRILFVGGYWAASALLFPLIGVETIWVWLLVVSMIAFFDLPFRIAATGLVLVVLAQLAVAASVGFIEATPFAIPITALTGASLLISNVIGRSNRNLRTAHDEIARLAVVEERARFSRDLHDVLGHYLTVVTVKSNLARRLVRLDPDQAESEITDIEELSRKALADLRTAVTSYRELTLTTELAAAGQALSAAGIAASLPDEADGVDPRLRAVFAWVLREGVTNVIRHSGASRCWVTIEEDRLTVADDGCGPNSSATDETIPASSVARGNGLRGLQERAAAVGAVLSTGRSAHGGFELTARRAA